MCSRTSLVFLFAALCCLSILTTRNELSRTGFLLSIPANDALATPQYDDANLRPNLTSIDGVNSSRVDGERPIPTIPQYPGADTSQLDAVNVTNKTLGWSVGEAASAAAPLMDPPTLSQNNSTYVRPSNQSVSKSSNDAVFFNVYINPESSNPQREAILRIIKDQLQQIKDAGQDRVVYYSLIGLFLPHSQEIFCVPGLTCHRLQYAKSGFENVTQQSLYEYCVSHPNARATYIHDKGSYHDHKSNHVKRQKSTRVVLSDECRYMPRDKCTVCTTMFRIVPFWHASGNFWTADCSYVRDLIPPKEYEARRLEMLDELFDASNAQRFKCLAPPLVGGENYTRSNQILSLGRHLWEYWIWNHPDLRPCDAFPHSGPELANERGRGDWSPRLIAPSRVIQSPPGSKLAVGPRAWYYGATKHAWFRMTGKLYEFRKLYGRDPAPDSPLWKILLPYNETEDGCEPPYKLEDNPAHHYRQDS